MEKLLEVRHLKKYFPVKKGFIKRTVGSVKATDDVTFDIYKGETLWARRRIRMWKNNGGQINFAAA